MKRTKLFLLLLMAAMVMPGTMQAKKIKYGQFVLYDGKVKKDIPTGEGTLTTTAGSMVDVLVGNFVGDGTVTNAQLKFPSGWKFTGTLSYEIEIDGSQVTYTLTEGQLYVISASIYKSNVHDFTTKVTPEYPIKLVRSPHANGNNLKAVYLNTIVPETEIDDDLIAPLTVSMFGDKATSTVIADCSILPTSQVKGTSGAGTDVRQNLQSKGFAEVREPWTFLIRPEVIKMADETTITKTEDDGKTMWMVQYANNDVFAYTAEGKSSVVKGIARQFADGNSLGYLDMDTVRNSIVVNYVDGSRLKGTILLKSGKVELTSDKDMKDNEVTDVFNAIMKAPNFESLNIRPYTATLTKEDKIIAEYKRGYNAAELKAKEEARAKQMEEGGELILEGFDVVGKWRMADPLQMANSYSYYALEITNDGKASIRLVTDYYDSWQYDANNPYYLRNVIACKGSYQLAGNKIVFNWQDIGKATNDTGIRKLYETTEYYPKRIIERKKKKHEQEFANLLRGTLSSPMALSVSDQLLVLGDGNHADCTFVRTDDETAEAKAMKKKQKAEEYLHDDGTNIISFKRYYEDGVVTFKQGEGFTIEYANGDKYVGSGQFGMITNSGMIFQTGFGNKYSECKGICNAVLALPRISDIDVIYYDGTLTRASGTTLTFGKGLTEKQQSGVQDNLEVIVANLQEQAMAKLQQMKVKSAETKNQLLAEGFPASYVNSMFDQYRILHGTPRSLVDRAIQLGCHITRSPVVMNTTGSRNVDYLVDIVNLNTGELAFSGFVQFYWLTDRVTYVGSQIPN